MAPRFASGAARKEVPSCDRSVTLPLVGEARNPSTVTSGDFGVDGDWILPLIEKAQEHVMQQKAALDQMRIDRAQYRRNLDGNGHLSIRRLGLMPKEFWLELADLIREHFGIDNDADRLARALKARAACDEVINEIARKGATR